MSACVTPFANSEKLFHGTITKGGHTHAVRMCKALMGDDALAPIFPDIHPAERRRFLAARDGNLEEAVDMLRSHLSWRSAHELAMANTEDPPPLIGSKLCAKRLNLLRGAGQNLRGREARPRMAAAACASGAASST